MAIRAFLRLERHFYATGVSWYKAKADVVRVAIRAYIARTIYKISYTTEPPTARKAVGSTVGCKPDR